MVLKVQEWQDILLFVERDNFLLAGLDLRDYLGTTSPQANQKLQVEAHGLDSEFLRWQIRAPFEAIEELLNVDFWTFGLSYHLWVLFKHRALDDQIKRANHDGSQIILLGGFELAQFRCTVNHFKKFDHLLQLDIPVRSSCIRIFASKPASEDFSLHLARNGNVSLQVRLHHRLEEIDEAFWIGFDDTSFLHLFRESLLEDDSVDLKFLLCVFLRIQLLYPAVQLLVDFDCLGSVVALLLLFEHVAQVAAVE